MGRHACATTALFGSPPSAPDPRHAENVASLGAGTVSLRPCGAHLRRPDTPTRAPVSRSMTVGPRTAAWARASVFHRAPIKSPRAQTSRPEVGVGRRWKSSRTARPRSTTEPFRCHRPRGRKPPDRIDRSRSPAPGNQGGWKPPRPPPSSVPLPSSVAVRPQQAGPPFGTGHDKEPLVFRLPPFAYRARPHRGQPCCPPARQGIGIRFGPTLQPRPVMPGAPREVHRSLANIQLASWHFLGQTTAASRTSCRTHSQPPKQGAGPCPGYVRRRSIEPGRAAAPWPRPSR